MSVDIPELLIEERNIGLLLNISIAKFSIQLMRRHKVLK